MERKPRRLRAGLALALSAFAITCAGGDNPTAPTTPTADTVELAGCTTLRLRGQSYEVTACRNSTGPLTTVTIGGNCTVIIGCLSNGCIASGGRCN